MVVEYNNLRYIVNFKYTLKPEKAENGNLGAVDVSNYDAFKSVCSSTMVGFVQHKDKDATF
jgi:hypothetical protein